MLDDINFFPWREAIIAQHKRRFFFFLILSILLIVAYLCFAYLSLVKQQGFYLTQSREWKAQIAMEESKLEKLKSVEQKRLDSISRIQTFEAYRQRQNHVNQLMELISYLVPEGVYLNQLIQQKDQVELAGYSESIEQLELLLRRIEARDEISSVNIVSINSLESVQFAKGIAVGRTPDKTDKQTASRVETEDSAGSHSTQGMQDTPNHKGVLQSFILRFKFKQS